MNEDDVNRQLKNLISFIKKEAKERVDELRDEGEQEFNSEKNRIIQENKAKINAEFEKRKKALEARKKIAFSNELNHARLGSLKAREESLQEVYATAFHSLAAIEKGPNYPTLLINLILQGLYLIREETVIIVARQEDIAIIRPKLQNIIGTYREKTGDSVNLVIDDRHFLAPSPSNVAEGVASCAGGVVLSAREGRIMCNNTFEQRLNLAYENLLPSVRTSLFGASSSRRHFD